MTPEEARERFAAARVARLATVAPDGAPHLVPVCFAVDDDDTILTAVDAKPKRTPQLQRLRNIEANPAVALLVDEYDEDWRRLWWARADGRASVLPISPRAVALLRARYPQYADAPPQGPVIAVSVHRWSGWLASRPAGR